MKITDKAAVKDWNSYVKQIVRATPIDQSETADAKELRIQRLQNNWEEFFKYYFPNYCTSDFADFQRKFMNAVIYNERTITTAEFARDHAKSTLLMMKQIYLFCTGRSKNYLLVSYSADNAEVLLKPLKLQFENNQRLINDYGTSKGYSSWEGKKFVTLQGWSCRSIGLGQSPRGTKDEEERPDSIDVDDADEDEMVRNQTRLDDAEAWVWGALFGCFSIEGGKRFTIVNNRIAQDCLIVRAIKRSNFHLQVNILSKQKVDVSEVNRLKKKLAEVRKLEDEKQIELYEECLQYASDGMMPTWSERFSIEDCVFMIIAMGYILSQREYFNNPIVAGKHFKKEWFVFKKMPPLKAYKFLLAYLDPGFKKTKTADTKSLVLIGLYNGEFHIRKVFCGKATTEQMVEWCYLTDALVKRNSATYRLYMEEVFLQDLLYKDFDAAAKRLKYPLPLLGDKRKKPDKDSRILATTGYYERGSIYIDIDIENDHHVQELISQYLGFDPSATKIKKDGPDAVEGNLHLLQQMVFQALPPDIGERSSNKYKLN